MVVLLLVVFNVFILFFVIDLVMQFFLTPTNFHAFLSGIFAFLIVIGLAFLLIPTRGNGYYDSYQGRIVLLGMDIGK